MTKAAGGGIERLLIFSDAVVAIAITLLALDLPVPTGATSHELWSSVRANSGWYGAFLVSFLVIAASWTQHHSFFGYVERSDARLQSIQFAWLFTIILNPFITKLLTERGHQDSAAHAWRFVAYSVLQVISSSTVLALVHHVRSAHLLSKSEEAQKATKATLRACLVSIAGFAVAAPVFFATRYAWTIWIAVPVLAGLKRRRTQGAKRAEERP